MNFKLDKSKIKSALVKHKTVFIMLLGLVLVLVILLIAVYGNSNGGNEDGGNASSEQHGSEDSKEKSDSETEQTPSDAESDRDKQPGLEAESRPEENKEIPYKNTKLYHVFDYVDKYHLYIRTRQHILSDFGYTTHVIEYAFNGVKIYLHQEVNGEDLHYYSDGKQLYGLDFEEQTYTLLAPNTYTADEILYLGNYTHCSDTGKDEFLGKTLDYEDFTATDTEWIRYYFNEDESLAGYERYDTLTNEIIEITSYEMFTSEFPEDAVLYFDIPAGFDKYTDVIEFSDLFWEEY
ncbi:MAG: hypothetical protein E7597_01305 [Ruminococcaceae bacterium]|nr:hypothetical protein [Oscillospiraceae bacterium]